jgi:hypothetical protein
LVETQNALCHHRSLAAVTFIYCYPTVLETEAGRVGVDLVLASPTAELALGGGVRLRGRSGNSIAVRDIEPR